MDETGCTPLILASDAGHLAIVAWLLGPEVAAKLGAADTEGQTALHYAGLVGHDAVVQVRCPGSTGIDI